MEGLWCGEFVRCEEGVQVLSVLATIFFGAQRSHRLLLQLVCSVSRRAPSLRKTAVRTPEGMLSLLLGLTPAATAPDEPPNEERGVL